MIQHSPRADDISNPSATLRPYERAGAPRGLSVRVEGSELAVDLPADLEAGPWVLDVRANSAPRILECEGVASCAFHQNVAAQSIEHRGAIEVYE